VAITGIAMPWLRFHNQLSAWQINLFFVINLIAVGSLIFLMVYYFVSKKNFFQARSEALLLNILPKEIAGELKTYGRAEAKHFDQVTVMFTDFKNFTGISEKLSPTELVAEIDTLFRAFDRIISRHPIEKIKTIGDSYMCAGGLPVPNNTHAFDVVNASLEILHFMQQHLQERKKEGWEPFEIRIGVHTGPVVAGIVGEKKFAYDIWGDTVNLASRMETSGEAGKINISYSTYELIKDKFNCTYRGKINAKSKGETDMYFVEGLKLEEAVIPGQQVTKENI
jgi:class 3 adenylate cyclase